MGDSGRRIRGGRGTERRMGWNGKGEGKKGLWERTVGEEKGREKDIKENGRSSKERE